MSEFNEKDLEELSSQNAFYFNFICDLKDEIKKLNKEYHEIEKNENNETWKAFYKGKISGMTEIYNWVEEYMNKSNDVIKESLNNLKEIIDVAEPNITNNDENVVAALDLEDLKSLKVVLQYIEKLENDKDIDFTSVYLQGYYNGKADR